LLGSRTQSGRRSLTGKWNTFYVESGVFLHVG
jgi:hypothetical protein